MKFDELNQKLIQEYGSEILQRMTGPKLQELLYNLIIDKKPKNCLELGSGYGVSSCFIGAALDEIGNGNLITIDRRAVLEKAPPHHL
jgi:predicted O-methyltransferase YrrM